jgi:hypothetical protein
MKLKSMEVSRRKERMETAMIEHNQYPYGLVVSLDDDSIEKLGMNKLPDVDEVLMLHARVKVTRVSAEQFEGDRKLRSVGLQITDMALEAPGDDKSAADRLYNKEAHK